MISMGSRVGSGGATPNLEQVLLAGNTTNQQMRFIGTGGTSILIDPSFLLPAMTFTGVGGTESFRLRPDGLIMTDPAHNNIDIRAAGVTLQDDSGDINTISASQMQITGPGSDVMTIDVTGLGFSDGTSGNVASYTSFEASLTNGGSGSVITVTGGGIVNTDVGGDEAQMTPANIFVSGSAGAAIMQQGNVYIQDPSGNQLDLLPETIQFLQAAGNTLNLEVAALAANETQTFPDQTGNIVVV